MYINFKKGMLLIANLLRVNQYHGEVSYIAETFLFEQNIKKTGFLI